VISGELEHLSAASPEPGDAFRAARLARLARRSFRRTIDQRVRLQVPAVACLPVEQRRLIDLHGWASTA